jgi:hypothetical protein
MAKALFLLENMLNIKEDFKMAYFLAKDSILIAISKAFIKDNLKMD